MLTFYPEFDVEVKDNVDIIFLIDMSNSMKGATAHEAKKVGIIVGNEDPWYSEFLLSLFFAHI